MYIEVKLDGNYHTGQYGHFCGSEQYVRFLIDWGKFLY